MRTKLISAPLAAAVVVATALLVIAPTFSQSSAAHRGFGPLVGEWRMVSLEVATDGNRQKVPYSGEIIFTKSGTMAVQAMNPDVDAPDTPYTVNGYEAFYGDFTANRAAGTFVVTVKSSAVRELIGQRLTRAFEVSRDTLVLTPTDPAEGWRVTYERV